MLYFMERSTIYYLKHKGWTNVQIAQFTGHHRDTIARVLREEVDKQPQSRQRPSMVAVFAAQINSWLDKGLSVIRMLELAREDAEHPYQGGETAFYDYVRHPCVERASSPHTTWRCALKGCRESTYKSIGARCERCPSPKRA
jgi:hypothetical protein